MAADFDELVETLLNRVTLSGTFGFGTGDLEKAAKEFYDAPTASAEQDEPATQHDLLFSHEPPANKPRTIDAKFLERVWDWLCEHPDIETRKVKIATAVVVDSSEAAAEPSVSSSLLPKISGERLFANEDRAWNAIAGHGIDLKRLPALEFECLSVIARHGPSGILQPQLTHITGQDKRSVPRRTDMLVEKGYIIKSSVLADTGRGIKTSLLKLKKYATETGERVIMTYDHWFAEIMEIFKSQPNWVVVYQDLRIGLGIEGKFRETRILGRCIRRMTAVGCISRIIVREQLPGSEPGKPVRCLQLMREPTRSDRITWEKINKNSLRTNKSDTNQLGDENMPNDDDDELDEDNLVDLESLHRNAPQWNPDLPYTNFLFNIIDNAGPGGISSVDLREKSMGKFWHRPLDEVMARMTDVWQTSQPAHLRHLAVVRDTTIFNKSVQYRYRSYGNFEKAVEQGLTVWDVVKKPSQSKETTLPPGPPPSNGLLLDDWGFPKIQAKKFGRSGNGPTPIGRGTAPKGRPPGKKGRKKSIYEDGDSSDESAAFAVTARRSRIQSKGKFTTLLDTSSESARVSIDSLERYHQSPEKATTESEPAIRASTSLAPPAGTMNTEHSSSEQAEDLSLATTEPPTAINAVPEPHQKRRGRPRKTVVPSDAAPKKRGRPTKAMVAERERLAGVVPSKHIPARRSMKSLIVKLRLRKVQSSMVPLNATQEEAMPPPSVTPTKEGQDSIDKIGDEIPHVQPYYEQQSVPGATIPGTVPAGRPVELVDEALDDTDVVMLDADANTANDLQDNSSKQTETAADKTTERDTEPSERKRHKDYKAKAGTTLAGGIVNWRRTNIILETIRGCDGVFPGNGEILQPFTEAWERLYKQEPDRHTVANSVKNLVDSGQIKEVSFKFEKGNKGVQVRKIITLPDVGTSSEAIAKLQNAIVSAWPKPYLPNQDPVLSRQSSVPTPKHWARDSFVTMDSIVVTRTAKYLSWADKEAQALGYADAQEKLRLTAKPPSQPRQKRVLSKKISDDPPSVSELHDHGPDNLPLAIVGLMTAPSQIFHLPSGTFGTTGSLGVNLAHLQPRIALEMYPQSLVEILGMARTLGHPAASSSENLHYQYEREVNRVKEWELELVERDTVPTRIQGFTFINHILNLPLVVPILEDGLEWKLQAASGRSKIRTVPSKAQDNTIGLKVPGPVPALIQPVPNNVKDGAKSRLDNFSIVDETPPAKKKYQSRKRKVQFDEEENADIDSQATQEKPFKKRNKRATAGFKDVDRLVTAIAVVRTLCGGITMFRINWELIAHAMSFRYEGNFLRQRWGYFRSMQEANVQRLQAALREPFLAAYERGDLPKINFQNLAMTDLPGLFNWVENEILPLPDEDPAQLPDLPVSSEMLHARYTEEKSLNSFEQPKDSFFHSITDVFRRDMALTYVHGTSFPTGSDLENPKHDGVAVLKSWCRAVAMTKQWNYNAEAAAQKLGVFTGAQIKRANRELLDDQILAQERGGRQLPGRNYYLNMQVYKQFKRWPEPDYLHVRQMATARAKVVDELAQADSIALSYHAADVELIVFHNMVAQGHLRTTTVLPERNDDFDAPFPKLTAWGYTDFDYRTKAVDKSRLTFPLVYEKTPKYTPHHGLTPAPVPMRPRLIANDIGFRIPLWVDIHGNLIDDAWDMALRSLLHLLVFRPGITSEGMEKSHKGKFGLWEIEVVVDWMGQVGIAERWGVGDFDEHGVWKGGWKAGEWWYCAFMPDIATWKAPAIEGRT